MNGSGANLTRWGRQAIRVAAFEVRKTLSGRRWLAGLVAAGAPVFFMAIALLAAETPEPPPTPSEVGTVFAVMFQTYILRLAIFFVAADVFTRVYRGEIMEKTLHFYLLSPVRREVVLLGKYLAGLGQMIVTFVPATVAAYYMIFRIAGVRTTEAHFVGGDGLAHLAMYGLITVLACMGYGAFFLILGLVAKNPSVPAVLFLGWESINVFLPPMLQKISVIYYLQSICPVPLPFGPLAVITEPTSPWVSVPGILVTTALVLAAAGFLMRRAEVSYTTD